MREECLSVFELTIAGLAPGAKAGRMLPTLASTTTAPSSLLRDPWEATSKGKVEPLRFPSSAQAGCVFVRQWWSPVAD